MLLHTDAAAGLDSHRLTYRLLIFLSADLRSDIVLNAARKSDVKTLSAIAIEVIIGELPSHFPLASFCPLCTLSFPLSLMTLSLR